MEGYLYGIDMQSENYGEVRRPVLYFKGCSLNCSWCHVNDLKSVAGSCILESDDQDEKYRMTLEQVMQKLNCQEWTDEQKKIGVVLAGGELLLQTSFAMAIIKELKKMEIYVGVETTGNAPAEDFNQVAPLADVLYWDLKLYDPVKHKQMTKADNQQVVQNFKWAAQQELPVLAKIQVLHGVNEKEKDARQYVRFLKEIGVKKVALQGMFSRQYAIIFQRAGMLKNL